MLTECYRVLKNNGKLYGFFPSIFSGFEIALLHPYFAFALTHGMIDIIKNSVQESNQTMAQIFYSPIRFNHIIKKIGFKRKKMEMYFLDTSYFLQESKRVYGSEMDSETVIWEMFVILCK